MKTIKKYEMIKSDEVLELTIELFPEFNEKLHEEFLYISELCNQIDIAKTKGIKHEVKRLKIMADEAEAEFTKNRREVLTKFKKEENKIIEKWQTYYGRPITKITHINKP